MAVAATEASGTAEPAAAEAMVDALKARLGVTVGTLGGDKGYDSGPHLIALEGRGVDPHAAMKARRRRP
jgi:IS5 family transposase